MATVTNGLSNARVEAINNKIKLTIRMGYGFRNIDNLIALVMLRCSNVRLPLPGRA
jgi:transposase